MVVSVVTSIGLFFSLRQVKKSAVSVVFAPSRDYLVLKHVLKGSIPQNEKHRMCISSRDLNYAKNNLCDFIKNDVEF